MRFYLALIISILMAGSAFAFVDLDESHEYFEAVDYWSDAYVLQGYDDGSFGPNDFINRAEFLKLVLAANEIELDGDDFDCFLDVGREWFAPFVCAAKDAGWIEGYADGFFRPAEIINRAEAAKILLEVSGIELFENDIFVDVPDGIWFDEYAQTLGTLTLDFDETFNPDWSFSRAQVAQILFELLTEEIEVEVEEVVADFVWPISGSTKQDELRSAFGPRLQNGSYDFHRGVDIPADRGTDVHAINGGEVHRFYFDGEDGSPYPNSGNIVILSHDDGDFYSLYAHLDSIENMERGDEINLGDVIGESGSSGTATWEHLHFEIRENSLSSDDEGHINPLGYLPYDDEDNYEISVSEDLNFNIIAYDYELDINRIEVRVYDNDVLIDEKILDFNERLSCGSDDEETDGILIEPESFSSSQAKYEINVDFTEINPSSDLRIEYSIYDLNGEVASGEFLG
ncbi:peptidoglycan DD-metalloendopeptidase family protein [Candidatus Peregrinibacteria bacterium]|jgi:murein DD-endopeptidase MepM/ murein hydrolase activator NlpD|nr:peptidoglycan DD-metalloendopeptidase family protein [Candidatus Peregrinibacteria bacterium]MBT4631442.1 peptidoglycan DD-metalloendopeptidase family protein [Candidatus Peregrinibacteria bacterium]MBT5516909.1 peptidoglycan DD-metalloendopeptidase family protein [Candidatus Peregrinibacteria bacterium]MBT5823831.1 peptidoglycan DD-metalloendopeptidase family protein [Candidatus Peregrinibacteria bacterium]